LFFVWFFESYHKIGEGQSPKNKIYIPLLLTGVIFNIIPEIIPEKIPEKIPKPETIPEARRYQRIPLIPEDTRTYPQISKNIL